jgi:hypothetical protein
MIGWLHIGTSGFGLFEVTGRSRDPSPPAITTAFKLSSPVAKLQFAS